MQQEKCGTVDLRDVSTALASLEDVKSKVFPKLSTNFRNKEWIRERAILAPKNKQVQSINHELLKQLPGDEYIYLSMDSTVETKDATHYPIEVLNALDPSGTPPHRLILKCGAPIMLLRNLNPPALCNGTRLIVRNLHRNIIEAEPIDGPSAGKVVMIPRITFLPTELPVQFKRVQFPIKVCYAITINKAQGQTYRVTGVDLSEDVFSHGQLYVALSRVGTKRNVYTFHHNNSKASNIVYEEALI